MNPEPKPDFSLTLAWQGGQRLQASSGDVSLTLDGKRAAGPSPVQAVAYGLAGCMAIDVVDMIEKGRFVLKAMACEAAVFRVEEVPRRISGINLHFSITGDIPEDRVARAIELSREKYCSVWHSMNPSIDFKTSFTVHP